MTEIVTTPSVVEIIVHPILWACAAKTSHRGSSSMSSGLRSPADTALKPRAAASFIVRICDRQPYSLGDEPRSSRVGLDRLVGSAPPPQSLQRMESGCQVGTPVRDRRGPVMLGSLAHLLDIVR